MTDATLHWMRLQKDIFNIIGLSKVSQMHNKVITICCWLDFGIFMGLLDDLMVCSFSVELHCTYFLCTINKLHLCCSITENEQFIIISLFSDNGFYFPKWLLIILKLHNIGLIFLSYHTRETCSFSLYGNKSSRAPKIKK